MNIYVSTFISGLQEPIKEFVLKQISDVKILDIYDGLIVYCTNTGIQRITELKYFNNSFLLLKRYDNLKSDSIEFMIKDAIKMKDLEKRVSNIVTSSRKQFRIITSRENKLTPVNNEVLKLMELKIAQIYGFIVNRAKSDYEFWFLYRREKVGFFLMRLTKHTSYEKVLQKGELRPELCHILCLLSEPNNNDIFLDPFCGCGAIPFERALMSPYNMIFLSDKSEDKVKYCKSKIKQFDSKRRKHIIIKQLDSLKMNTFEEGFIRKIVTDPPWGFYEDIGTDIYDFYYLMLKELNRLMKQNGIIIILTAKKDELENALKGFHNNLKIFNKYNILVSGKKASIYKIIKI